MKIGNNSPVVPFVCALREFWRVTPDLFLFEIVFRVVEFMLLAPIVSWLFQRFIAKSGSEAIGNFDIAVFLISPFGITIAILFVVLATTIRFSRLAGQVLIGYGAAQQVHVSYFDALQFVATRFLRIMRVCCVMLSILVAVALPFVGAIAVSCWLLLTDHDINYYLHIRPPEFRYSVVIGITILGIGLIALVFACAPLVYVLPQALATKEGFQKLLKQGRRLARGRLLTNVATLFIWGLTVTLVSLSANGTTYFIGRTLVSAARENDRLLVMVLGVVTSISLLINFFIEFAASSLFCLVVVQLDRTAREHADTPRSIDLPSQRSLGDRPQWSLHRRAPFLIAVVSLVLSALVVHQILEQVQHDDQTQITAHRGASLVAPENTLSAVRQAIAYGATHVEFDVQRTADGMIVVNHDADLMRVAKSPLVITQSTFSQLRSVDVGRSFNPEFAGEVIPTLEEVIEVAKGKIKLVVELKSYNADPSELVTDVVRILRERKTGDDALIMSLKYKEVQEVKKIAPEIKTGFAASATIGDISKLDADFLAVSKSMATDVFISSAHAHDKDVFVWTIDDPAEMSKMIDRGVDNLITNDPAAASRVMQERRELGNAERILLRFKSLYLH